MSKIPGLLPSEEYKALIISQKCTAALESCLFQQFVSGGLPSCASFMTRHSTDESCSLVISLSGVAGVILGNTNERIHICGRWASRASCEVGRSGFGINPIGEWPANSQPSAPAFHHGRLVVLGRPTRRGH